MISSKSAYMRKKDARHIYFCSIAHGVKFGGIPLHIVNGQLFIDEEEADAYFAKQLKARLATQRPKPVWPKDRCLMEVTMEKRSASSLSIPDMTSPGIVSMADAIQSLVDEKDTVAFSEMESTIPGF